MDLTDNDRAVLEVLSDAASDATASYVWWALPVTLMFGEIYDSLEAMKSAGLVQCIEDRLYWRITDLGRKALETEENHG